MKINQIAYLSSNEKSEQVLKASLGLTGATWTEDIITANVKALINGTWHEGVGQTRVIFNYSLGMEFEIINVLSGPHFHTLDISKGGLLFNNPFQTMLSHMGLRLEQDEQHPTSLPYPWRKVYQADTTSHTNPFIVSNKRTYRLDAWQNGDARDFRVYIKRMSGEE